jgi:hypothetical protein
MAPERANSWDENGESGCKMSMVGLPPVCLWQSGRGSYRRPQVIDPISASELAEVSSEIRADVLPGSIAVIYADPAMQRDALPRARHTNP